MTFEEAQAEYIRLRQAYDGRALPPEEYARRIQSLQVRDQSGGYWAIDGATGGWLRYNGTAWVPGQPPGLPGPAFAPQSPGGYGQPQGGYGYPQGAQGYVAQPAGAGYGPTPQAGAPVVAATPRQSRRGLIAGCVTAFLVLTLACGVGGFLLFRSGLFNTTAGLTAAAVARSVTADNLPDARADQFSVAERVYVTYTAQRVRGGDKVELRLFRNNAPVVVDSGGETVFPENGSFNGYFEYVPRQAGEYRAELRLNGEGSPTRTVTFSVR